MPLEITFTLEEQDLDHFRGIMEAAQKRAEALPEAEVASGAKALLESVAGNPRAPAFVVSRLKHLKALVAMLDDEDWQLAGEERTDVVSALAYFFDPKDIIDDSVPVLGLIDDAIMIELVSRQMQQEIKAYEEFCVYRSREESNAPGKNISREDWLNSKRRELMDHMRNRRQNRVRGGRFTRFSFR